VREVSRSAGSSGLVCNDRYLVCYSLADWQPVQLSSQLRGTNRTRCLTHHPGQCVLRHLQLVEVGGSRAVQ